MINQLRTLLLNETPSPGAANEEYIEPDFVPLPLTLEMSAFRQALLKSKWPRDYKNFVATRLAWLAETSPYDGIIKKNTDPRTTLPLYKTEPAVSDRISVERISQASSFDVFGSFNPSPEAGVFTGRWDVAYSSGGSVLVTDLNTQTSTIIDVTFDGDASNPYLLAKGTGLYFRFLGVTEVPSGFEAVISANYAMDFDILSALGRIKADFNARNIFLSDVNQSLLSSLQDRFFNALRPDLQLAAGLAAYALRTSELL